MTAPGTAVGGAGRDGDGTKQPPARRCSPVPGPAPSLAALPPPGAPARCPLLPPARTLFPRQAVKREAEKSGISASPFPTSELPRASPGSGPAATRRSSCSGRLNLPQKNASARTGQEKGEKERVKDVKKKTKNDLRKCLQPSSLLPGSRRVPSPRQLRATGSELPRTGVNPPGRRLPPPPRPLRLCCIIFTPVCFPAGPASLNHPLNMYLKR